MGGSEGQRVLGARVLWQFGPGPVTCLGSDEAASDPLVLQLREAAFGGVGPLWSTSKCWCSRPWVV